LDQSAREKSKAILLRPHTAVRSPFGGQFPRMPPK
jgi:hypothetical protein